MAPRRQGAPGARPPTRLYLITPPIEDARGFAPHLDSALEAGDIAAVLLRIASPEEGALYDAVARLAPAVQRRGVALLLDGRPECAARLGADGAHLTGTQAIRRGIELLKPDRIAGAGGLETRHDAMVAGESGADYVMFGEPDATGSRPPFPAIVGRVAWWAELFELPCVGYAADFEAAGRLAAAGADFVALGDGVWTGDVSAAVRTAAATIRALEALE